MDLLLDVRFSLAERTFEAVRTLVAQSSVHHSSLVTHPTPYKLCEVLVGIAVEQ